MKYIALLALILSSYANAQCFGPGGCDYVPPSEPCFGPGGCVDPAPVGPAELCLPEGCQPVTYEEYQGFTLAFSFLVNGYPVMGWSGACDQPVCPDIKNQAFADLLTNAKRANRAQRY